MPRLAGAPVPDTALKGEVSGRYVITFGPGKTTEGLAVLENMAGVTGLANAAEFRYSALDVGVFEDPKGGAVFPTIGVAVAPLEDSAVASIKEITGKNSKILAIEPERIFYAITDKLQAEYLRGYRDAVNHLYDRIMATSPRIGATAVSVYQDDAESTWGLKATNVLRSRYAGSAINVAVLDTGLDLLHQDFGHRSITKQSFVQGQDAQDKKGHGTHCIGTACGFKDTNGRRYGIAHDCNIFVGKVLDNSGSGPTSGILAGIEWAVINQCQIISMSLGLAIEAVSAAFEQAGMRALQNGCLLIAAAGNEGPSGKVGQPANSESIMAVAALDSNLHLAWFSTRAGSYNGAQVDISGPGVNVYSCVPMSLGAYGLMSGTSMATPHVAGIAALWAEATGDRGENLWRLLCAKASKDGLALPDPNLGCGLVQAPV
jgi:subtilisin family serine protease